MHEKINELPSFKNQDWSVNTGEHPAKFPFSSNNLCKSTTKVYYIHVTRNFKLVGQRPSPRCSIIPNRQCS